MQRFFSKVNGDLKLSSEENSRYSHAVHKFNGLYMTAVKNLTDMCFQNNLSILEEDTVKRAIIESYDMSLIEYLKDYDGTLSWSKDSILYAMYKLEGNPDKEVQEFVNVLGNFKVARESAELLDSMQHIRNNLDSKNTAKGVIFRYNTYIRDFGKRTKLNTKNAMDFLERTPCTELITVDIQTGLYKEFIIYLGEVLEKDMTEYLKLVDTTEDGLFVKGLTRKQEYEIFESILDRRIKCDTELGKLFDDYMTEQFSFDNPRAVKDVKREKSGEIYTPFVLKSILTERVQGQRTEIINDILKKYRYVGKVAKPYFMTHTDLYFEVTSNHTAQPVSSEYGKYIYDNTNCVELPAHNLVDGLYGEYILYSEVQQKRYYANCKPTKITTIVKEKGVYKKKPRLYVPIQNVFYGGDKDCTDNTKYMYKNIPSKIGIGNVTNIVRTDPKKVFEHFNVDSLENLFEYFRKGNYIDDTDPAIMNDYVAELLCAFCMLSLCTQEYIFLHSYEYVLDKQQILKSQYIAEKEFEKFKNTPDFTEV